MKTNFEHFSKQVVRILLSITLPCTAAAETQDAAPPETYTLGLGAHGGEIHITENDIIGVMNDKTHNVNLSTTEQKESETKDCIVTAVVTDKDAWYSQIPGDNRSYLGMKRNGSQPDADAYSCVGGTVSYPDGTNQFVFNRAEPGSKMGPKDIVNSTADMPYEVLCNTMTDGEAPTLQGIYDAIAKNGCTVAIGILRTPGISMDMYAISIKDSNDVFQDYVIGCAISSTADQSGLVQVNMDPHRFSGGTLFLGNDYGMEDLIAANHYSLVHHMPEPTTATLGLAALAGLCTRRRRK